MISVIILAIIQAITEFLPVSSSGHLLAVQEVTNVEGSLVLDVALHFGTLLALIVYFWPRLSQLIIHPLKGDNPSVIRNLILTSIPAALAGFLFADFFEEDARALGVVIVMLATVGLIMIYADTLFAKKGSRSKVESILPQEAWLIGLGQALALIPGTSRSGVTMLSARALGMSNKLAAEYAFLAGIPIIAGASLKVLLENKTAVADEIGTITVGVLVSAIVGYAVLNFLIKFVAERGLALFGWYRLALASLLFIIMLNQ